MSKHLPKSDELYESVIDDMYLILFSACNTDARKSIEIFLEVNKDFPKINNKINLLKFYSSIKDFYGNKNMDIIHLTTNYIKYIEICLNNYVGENLQLIEDFCLAYLALVGFRYIFDSNFQDEQLFLFDLTFFDKFSSLIENYSLTIKIKELFEKKVIPLKNEKNKYITLIQLFDRNKIFNLAFSDKPEEDNKIDPNNNKEILDSKKNKQNDLNGKGNDDTNEISKTNNLNNEERSKEQIILKGSSDNENVLNKDNNDNKKNNNDITTQKKKNEESFKVKNNELNINNNNNWEGKELIQRRNDDGDEREKNVSDDSKIEKIDLNENNNIIEEKEIQKNNLIDDKINSKGNISSKSKETENSIIITRINNLELSNLNLELSNLNIQFKLLETNESLCIQSIINSSYFDVDKIKINYLDAVICSLNNIVTKLSNPYNFNLWRKISNIILKNIFIILKSNKFTISQNVNESLSRELISQDNKNKIRDMKEFNKRIKNYEAKSKDKGKITTKNISPSADKERQFNLITIYNGNKPEITASLSIDFLFYLKERGNEINHFDEKILNLILFDNLEIKGEIVDQKELEEEKTNEIKNDDSNLNIINTGKTEFSGDELIDFLENPLKFQKKDDYITDKLKFIYSQIEEFKKSVGYKDNNKKICELKNEGQNILLKIEELLNNLETDFKNNNIDINNIEKIKDGENVDFFINKKIKIYSSLKELDGKTNEKLILYENIKERYENLNTSILFKKQKINELIQEIKIGIDKIAKLIKMSDILKYYKDELLEKIKNENEYKNRSEIFNENTINNFTIDKFYSFLRLYLNSKENRYSIIKRDITKYNLYAAILEEFHEFKGIYKDNCDISF